MLDMYPVYPELGWIHSVSSVSQLSEAAYTRRPNAFCAAAGAGVGVAAATIAAGAAAARAVAAGAGAGAGAGTRAVAPAPRRARSGFGLKGIGDGDLRRIPLSDTAKKNVLVFETGGCVSHCVSTVYPD